MLVLPFLQSGCWRKDSIEGLKYVPLTMPIYSNVYIVKRKEKTLNATTEKFWKFLCGKYQEYQQ